MPSLTESVIVQAPKPSAVVEPTELPSRSSSTKVPASAVPLKVGVLSLVMLSVLELPLSELVARSGGETAGAAVSIVTVSEPEATLVLPAVSVALALI